MKLKFACVLTTLLAASLPVHAETQHPLTVAVFEFDSPYKVMRHDVTDLLIANLSADPQVSLVERSDLKKALSEQALGLSGNVSAATAAKVGQLTGAKVLVTGRVFKVGAEWTISTRIIGTETGRIFSEIAQGSRTNLVNLTSNLSHKIVQTIADQTTNLIAYASLSHEERIDKIVARIKGKPRQAVRININEKIGETGIQSQTTANELALVFQKAGFQVVGEKSDKLPDIIITGDAVASDNVRRGELFSSRARLEIQAQERLDGKVLSVDRQVSIAIDIGKENASRLALGNAADALAERLLPLLAN